MQYRVMLMAAASAASLISSAALAQTAAPAAAEVEELVVTGTRTTGRSRLDTLAPVDVVTTEALQQVAAGL